MKRPFDAVRGAAQGRPGTRLRAIASRLCGAQTMARLIDPTIADLQAEYEHAVGSGRRWESRRILVLGHLALARVVAVHACLRTAAILRDSSDDDHKPVRRTVLASAVTIFLGTVLLMLPFLQVVLRSHPHPAEAAFYFIPQTLPLSIPIGLTFGILWGLSRVSASYRSRAVILSFAVVASLISFTMLAWVVPMAGQAYRVAVIGHPLPKSMRELTLGELRTTLNTPASEPTAAAASPRMQILLASEYHKRWAMSGAPFTLALFAIALTRRRQWGRTMLLLAGCFAIVGYYVVMFSAMNFGLQHALSAFAAAWLPNFTFLVMSLAIMRLNSQWTNGPAPA